MGPACAIVDARADGATLWTGSQKPHFARDGVACILGFPQDKVRGIWIPGPGSYGRNDAGDAGSAEAGAGVGENCQSLVFLLPRVDRFNGSLCGSSVLAVGLV
jgi:hypothetical protein